MKFWRQFSHEVNYRAEDNLLWACLVFNDLETMTGSDALKNIEDYPRGLTQLYDHKITRLQNGGDETFGVV
jgi:hypothetical protein